MVPIVDMASGVEALGWHDESNVNGDRAIGGALEGCTKGHGADADHGQGRLEVQGDRGRGESKLGDKTGGVRVT